MNKLLPVAYLIFAQPLLSIGAEKSESWDLAATYTASTAVFYGSVEKSIPEPRFKTGVMGVDVTTIEGYELPMQEIVWTKARELTFNISDAFKGSTEERIAAYQPDHRSTIWTHVQNEAGDVFLAQPEAPNPLIDNLQTRDEGLFFIRYYLGSDIPVIYHVRMGQDALDDLTVLRQFIANGGSVSMESLVYQAEQAKIAKAQRDAAAYKVFEDEYYKVLRIQDLDIRANLLEDLIQRIGFKGRWEYFAFKKRYIELHGHDLSEGDIPRSPTDGLEKLWHDISGELEKIDAVKRARRQ
ncbi:MAG: hypothetical protein ACON4O_07810 [Lentimonas sp.]